MTFFHLFLVHICLLGVGLYLIIRNYLHCNFIFFLFDRRFFLSFLWLNLKQYYCFIIWGQFSCWDGFLSYFSRTISQLFCVPGLTSVSCQCPTLLLGTCSFLKFTWYDTISDCSSSYLQIQYCDFHNLYGGVQRLCSTFPFIMYHILSHNSRVTPICGRQHQCCTHLVPIWVLDHTHTDRILVNSFHNDLSLLKITRHFFRLGHQNAWKWYLMIPKSNTG